MLLRIKLRNIRYKKLFLILISIISFSFPSSNAIAEYKIDEIVDLYKFLHSNPELSWQEDKTANHLADILEKDGYKVSRGIGKKGVVAILKNGKGPTLMIRADMDALPVEEKTGLPYASKVRTTYLGNDVGVMHACGHEAHVAILMGVAEFLAKNKANLKGDVVLIFQPAEEGPPEDEGGGAKMMLEEGIFDKYKPEVIFGLHVTNIPNGVLLVKSGPAMAAASSYRIKIKGVQAHGSTPWSSIDPIMATSQLIESLNTIVSRRINIINNPAVVSVGMVESGTRANIIPEDSMLMGTIRTFDPELRKEIYDEIEQIAAGVALSLIHI